MKAVVIHATGGPEQLTVADMPDPVPGPGEVLLDVAYAGCNWADTQVRDGHLSARHDLSHGAGLRGLGHGRGSGPGRYGRQGGRQGRELPGEGRRLCREMRGARRRPDQAAARRRSRCRRGVSDPGAYRLSHAVDDLRAGARRHCPGQCHRRRRRARMHPARGPCRRAGDRHDRHAGQGEACARRTARPASW